jgi:cell shape-determining protein MreD
MTSEFLTKVEKWFGWFRTLQQWQQVLLTIVAIMFMAVFYNIVMFLITWQMDSFVNSVFISVVTLFILAVLYLIAHFLGLFGKLLDRLEVPEHG